MCSASWSHFQNVPFPGGIAGLPTPIIPGYVMPCWLLGLMGFGAQHQHLAPWQFFKKWIFGHGLHSPVHALGFFEKQQHKKLLPLYARILRAGQRESSPEREGAFQMQLLYPKGRGEKGRGTAGGSPCLALPDNSLNSRHSAPGEGGGGESWLLAACGSCRIPKET